MKNHWIAKQDERDIACFRKNWTQPIDEYCSSMFYAYQLVCDEEPEWKQLQQFQTAILRPYIQIGSVTGMYNGKFCHDNGKGLIVLEKNDEVIACVRYQSGEIQRINSRKGKLIVSYEYDADAKEREEREPNERRFH